MTEALVLRWVIVALSAILLAGCGKQVEDPPAIEGSLAPHLIADRSGAVTMTWLEPAGTTHTLKMSHLEGSRWSAPATIAADRAFFANWADIPKVLSHGEVLYAHWLEELGEQTYAYGIRLVSRHNGGEWSSPQWLHDDESPTEHGFVSYGKDDEGAWAFWLDGRAMVDEEGAMQLRATRLAPDPPDPPDPRDPPDPTAAESSSDVLDARVCECCATDAAATDEGVIVAYRDRSDDEVRDIRVIRREGGSWSSPTLVAQDGWTIAGCPVNGPAIAASGSLVAVAWFTAADNDAQVKAALSNDGGRTFAPPLLIDDNRPVGRVDLAIDSAGLVRVLWMAEGGKIELQSLAADGTLGESTHVARATSQRASGFPRLVATEDRLLVVWRELKRLRARAYAL